MKKTSLKKNTFYNSIKTVFSIIFPIVTFPYVSRVLLVENVGKINFGLSFVSYFSLIASLGISVYAIRECSKYRDDREKLSEVASQMFSINLITTLFSYFLLFLFIIFYQKIENYRFLIIVQSLIIIFTTLGADWINTAVEDFRYITIRTIGFQLLSMMLLFAFVHKPSDYMKYAILIVLSNSGANIVNIFYRKKFCDIKFTKILNLTQHLKPIFYLFAMQIAQTIFTNIDITMLGVLKGDYDVGIYTAAHKMTNLIEKLVTSIMWVVLPRMSYYFGNKDKDSVDKLFNKILSFTLTFGLPMIVGTFMISNEIVQLFAGKPFSSSGVVLRILIISSLVTLFGGSLYGNIVLLSVNKEKYLMFTCIVTAVFNALANRVLIPIYGASGAAVTTVFSTILTFIFVYLKGRHYVRIIFLLKKIISPIVGCLAIIVICRSLLIIDNLYLRIFLSIILSAITYFSILFILKNEITDIVLTTFKERIK